MIQFGAIVRLLMLLLCLVPFTSAQQAGAVLAPFLPATAAPTGQASNPAPASEEDDERESPDGKERLNAPSRHRPAVRELTATLPPVHTSRVVIQSRVRTTPPVAADPFRNGLGTPYRC